jgi:multidrug resistance efflux pump
VDKSSKVFIVLMVVCVCLVLVILAWLIWQLATWLAQGNNAFYAYCGVMLSIMFVASLRDQARKWR